MQNKILEIDQSIVVDLKMKWGVKYFWQEISQFYYDKPLDLNTIVFFQKRELGE